VLFESVHGTSFATPAVAHVAGRVASHYPDATANTIRALVLQAAEDVAVRASLEDHYEGPELEQNVWHLSGHGVVIADRALFSGDDRVVLYAEDLIRADDFHVYRVPMTDSFSGSSGVHEVTVSLAYDPPVRHRRLDYMAYKIEAMVVRGVDIDDVYDMAGANVGQSDPGLLSSYELPMRPPRTTRSRGANQVGRCRLAQRPREKFREDWFVVVRCINRWLNPEEGPQRYSLAVALGAERGTELYAELEARLAAELEAETEIG
jgi:hypothetical protein